MRREGSLEEERDEFIWAVSSMLKRMNFYFYGPVDTGRRGCFGKNCVVGQVG